MMKEQLSNHKGFLTVVKYVEDRRYKVVDPMTQERRYARIPQVVEAYKGNLLTTAGRDWMHAQVYTNTSAGTRGSGFIALSEDSGSPAAGDTTVTGEIATNGLSRADAGTKTHTGGTNTTTISNTFTASGTFSAVQKSGLFNAASVGTLSHENTFTSTNLISGDSLAVSWTLTLG